MASPQNLTWITGARGLIGNYLVKSAARYAPHRQLRALTREQLNLLDFAAVQREFENDRPDLIIHCAAITIVADAKKNPALARQVNVEIPRLLASLAADIPLVLFSTDLVFDGRKGDYQENDLVNPLHVYGETKVEAEQIVLSNPRHLVVRTSINGGKSLTGDRAFNEQLRRSLQRAGEAMKLFTDEFRCPIPAAETARAVWELVEKKCSGIYHAAGAEKLSRWDIGRLLAKYWPDITAKLEPGSAREFVGPPRALDTSLNITKIQRELTTPLIGFSEWLGKNSRRDF